MTVPRLFRRCSNKARSRKVETVENIFSTSTGDDGIKRFLARIGAPTKTGKYDDDDAGHFYIRLASINIKKLTLVPI